MKIVMLSHALLQKMLNQTQFAISEQQEP